MSLKLVNNINEYDLELFEKQIRRICKPFFDSTPITFFEYNIVFKDLSRIILVSNPSWVNHFYQSQYFQGGIHYQGISSYSTGLNFWHHLGPDNVLIDASRNFGLNHGFTMTKTGKDCCEFFHFATSREKNGIEVFYLQNTDLLHRFITYFKSEAEDFLYYYYKKRIQFTNTALAHTKNESTIQNDLFPIKKFVFYQDSKFDYLTLKEMEVCFWVLEGKTAAEIAIILDNSKRTIEVTIDHIKAKLNCYKQTQIITRLYEIGFSTI